MKSKFKNNRMKLSMQAYESRKIFVRPQKNIGFTLVELLVGLVLSLFIIGVSLTYFVSCLLYTSPSPRDS